MSAPTPDDIRALYTSIGAALVMCQTAEHLINLSLRSLFPKEAIKTIEMLEQLEEQHRKKTLGYFITALRERVGLDEEFDALLGDFLEHRNTLVHDLERVPGHTFLTLDGMQRINAYAMQVLREAQRITEIFAAFIDAWTEQVGMRDDLRASHPDTYDSEFFAGIRATITPLLNDLVFKKPNA
jgi:hypothetical protein